MNLTKENIDKIIGGDKRTISRAISYIENNQDNKHLVLKSLYSHTGNAYKIGITGPPGAGKSTITDCLVTLLVKDGYKVGVIAVDPTSPFTGGALLGDRVRMTDSSLLENVFIRSMATRGSLGGLCRSVNDVCSILDASGKDFIIMETVGVGQSELDIAETADTTVVALVPESGDSIQAMKAGLMEIADIFVINKSDRQGADEIITGLKNMLHLRMPGEHSREINVIKTVASRNTGTVELLDEILSHKKYLETSGMLLKKRRSQIENEIIEIVETGLRNNFWNEKNREILNQNIDKILNKETDPYTLSEKLFGL
ncbi:MAG TPA: methylmalonyl Co-A mutase-associated GTPase MeaB [Ignavibacteria bacterium]|nr:methylmalonyl Co-A mutase-associated GTPase MeaB [Ignavibacteria bacterium]